MDMKRLPVAPSYCRRKSSDELTEILPPVSGMFWVSASCPLACRVLVATKL
jgi:hypothetical protein